MTSKPTPFHPDYGLGDAFRRVVLTYAQRTSVPDAADTYNVGVSTLYQWKQRMTYTNPNQTNGA